MATGSRAAFTIADETFDVAIDDGHVTIAGGGSREVKICTEAARWLSNLLAKCTRDKKEDPFWGRNTFGKLTITVHKKQSPTGQFLSIMFLVGNQRRSAATYICVPGEDADGSGWVGFASQIISPSQQARDPTSTVRANRGVVISSETRTFLANIRERGVVVSSDSDKIPWKRVPAMIAEIFRVSGAPSSTTIGHNRYVLGMGDDREFKIMLCIPRLVLPEGVISMKRWIPDRSNPLESWLSKHDRWVELEGVPTHLRDPVILSEMCSAFGSSVSRIDITVGRRSDSSVVAVVGALVADCDLFLMPHVAVLDDRGFEYPVKLTLTEDVAVAGDPGSYSKAV